MGRNALSTSDRVKQSLREGTDVVASEAVARGGTSARARRLWMGIGVAALVLVGCSTPAAGSNREAAKQVAEGVRQHRAGRFEEAEKAFSQAAALLPDDLRVSFNRGCAAAGQGETEEARTIFQSVVASKDPRLSAAARYNLGGLAAAEAKALFGDRPEEAAPDVRSQGVALMNEAVRYYRDCLRVQPTHRAARHNLELLRLWLKQMEDIWAQRDRERLREELGVLEFLEMLTKQQHAIRKITRSLALEDDSPRRRRAVKETDLEQKHLLQEIDPLREKIVSQLTPAAAPTRMASPSGAANPSGATGPSGGAASHQADQAIAVMHRMVDAVKESMSNASAKLTIQELDGASDAQTKALDALNEIYRALAPFEAIVSKAIETQGRLVGHSQSQTEADPDAGTLEAQQVAELVEEQRRVGGWAEVLPLKASAGLEALEASSPGAATALAQPEEEQAQADSGSGPDPSAEEEAAEARRAATRDAYEKAVETAPQIVELVDSAASAMESLDWAVALPEQEEALRLLKEIADALPKQPQENDQNQKNEQDQQQNDQSDQEQSPQQDEQQKPDPEPGEDESEQPDSAEDKEQPDQEGSDKPQPQRDLTQRQAEALLRQVRQREREHRERQKMLQQFLRGRIKVTKDW